MVTWMHGNSVERRHLEFAKKARCAWHMVKPLTKVHLVSQFYVIKAKKLNCSIWTKCPVNFVSGLKFFRCRVNEASTLPLPPSPPPPQKKKTTNNFLLISTKPILFETFQLPSPSFPRVCNFTSCKTYCAHISGEFPTPAIWSSTKFGFPSPRLPFVLSVCLVFC